MYQVIEKEQDLGLAICKTVLDLHGFSYDVHNIRKRRFVPSEFKTLKTDINIIICLFFIFFYNFY